MDQAVSNSENPIFKPANTAGESPVAVVTGGSDGLGAVIAGRLVAAGYEVLLPVRNLAKGQAVKDRILSDNRQASIRLSKVDLASIGAVKAYTQELLSEGRAINLVVNNAGIMNPPHRLESENGLELQLAVNYLAHFALVQDLLPLLSKGNARVTTQTSIMARFGRINWDDLQFTHKYSGMRAYGQSKLATLLFALELQRQSDAHGWGISSNAAHPGVSLTNLVAAQRRAGNIGDSIMGGGVRLATRLGLAQTASEGARPSVFAAIDPAAKAGSFYGPNGPGQLAGDPVEQVPYKSALDLEDSQRLWTVSKSLIATL